MLGLLLAHISCFFFSIFLVPITFPMFMPVSHQCAWDEVKNTGKLISLPAAQPPGPSLTLSHTGKGQREREGR